ncbi:hypothetical protein TNCV_4645781 [Trichonephila clavipes]|nr:hypothetical protein TNCV_4645781 [Trichonephila clavipes]
MSMNSRFRGPRGYAVVQDKSIHFRNHFWCDDTMSLLKLSIVFQQLASLSESFTSFTTLERQTVFTVHILYPSMNFLASNSLRR